MIWRKRSIAHSGGAPVLPPLAMASLTAALALFLTGCGSGAPDMAPVSGKVTLNGQPLTTGSIQFVPENQRPAYGQIGPDGSFTLFTDEQEGAVLGTHKVLVSAQETSGTEATGEVSRQITPLRYSMLEFTDIIVNVDGPKSDLLIELTGRP